MSLRRRDVMSLMISLVCVAAVLLPLLSTAGKAYGGGFGWGRFTAADATVSGSAVKIADTNVVGGMYARMTGAGTATSGTATSGVIIANDNDAHATGVMVGIRVRALTTRCAQLARPTVDVYATGGAYGSQPVQVLTNETYSWSISSGGWERLTERLPLRLRPASGDAVTLRVVSSGASKDCAVDVSMAGFANLAVFDMGVSDSQNLAGGAINTANGDSFVLRLPTSSAVAEVASLKGFAVRQNLRVKLRAVQSGCTSKNAPFVTLRALDAAGTVIWTQKVSTVSTSWDTKQYSGTSGTNMVPQGWNRLRITGSSSCGPVDVAWARATAPASV